MTTNSLVSSHLSAHIRCLNLPQFCTIELTSSWPSTFSKMKLTLTRLASSSAHPETGYEDTPAVYGKDQVAGNSVSISWTVNGPKSFLQHLCNFCSPSLTLPSILLPQTIYVSVTRKPWPVYVVITGPRGYSYHLSINQSSKIYRSAALLYKKQFCGHWYVLTLERDEKRRNQDHKQSYVSMLVFLIFHSCLLLVNSFFHCWVKGD